MEECKHCCMICKFYESRSGFCRFNPPTPVVVDDGNCSHTVAMWPKIAAPLIDWCSNFKHMNSMEIL